MLWQCCGNGVATTWPWHGNGVPMLYNNWHGNPMAGRRRTCTLRAPVSRAHADVGAQVCMRTGDRRPSVHARWRPAPTCACASSTGWQCTPSACNKQIAAPQVNAWAEGREYAFCVHKYDTYGSGPLLVAFLGFLWVAHCPTCPSSSSTVRCTRPTTMPQVAS